MNTRTARAVDARYQARDHVGASEQHELADQGWPYPSVSL